MTLIKSNDTSLDILKAAAILLVVNSHLDEFYPIPQLGTGGMFGNELFFFVSGYGLFLSFDKKAEPLWQWLKRRLARIYEPLFVVVTFLVLVGHFQIHTLSDFFWLYIVSKVYWFLPAIMAFYLPIYFVMSRLKTKREYIYLFVVISIVYILLFSIFAEKTAWITENFNVQTSVVVPLRMIYYFGTMALGVYMARYQSKTFGSNYDIVFLLLSAAAYYLFVASLGRFVPFQLQIIDRVPAAAFLVFAFRAARHPTVNRVIIENFGGMIALLAGLTLQIYLIHDYILHMDVLRSIAFPANLIVFATATVALAIMFDKIRFSGRTAAKPVPDGRLRPDQSAASPSMASEKAQ
ncbi:hypothetical protein UP09_07180 [Bradyrhizobium sp. LTSP885]|uniref:acyltransferase family protein n=1 Tax=Bradyrhizobium sp. LTSP885 TaxID=1619232 RepID=UPI0005CAFFD6|nr:acyltransferase [Bradyrhizobium sp. LTSP885]KJC49474.1 hypothetical protein UP09_07180 [Bradyrhizobium sp. LTSP885]